MQLNEMEMLIPLLLFTAGLIALILGADWLVDGASVLAKRYRVSHLVIGLTIVAFGTSAPELVVNSLAAVQGHNGIVFGNVIGSNNFNLFIILGASGLIYPLTIQSKSVRREIPLSLLAAVIVYILVHDHWFYSGKTIVLSRPDSLVLLLLFAGFLLYIFRQMKEDRSKNKLDLPEQTSMWFTITRIVLGLAGLILGGRLIVENAVVLAEAWGVSEQIIGLTIVSAGTSLPELATSLVAAWKKNNDIAVGNIIGSNIFNLLLVLPISALIHPVIYELSFDRDLYMVAGGTAILLLANFTGTKWKLDRWEAGVLLGAYLLYSIFLLF